MNVLSLFDGISCGRVALENLRADVTNYYACEIDKYATSVSKKNYPDIKRLGDINDWETWDLDFAKIDLILAGFPCQAWSAAGNQQGVADERGKLVYRLIDIHKKVRQVNPNVKFLFENVRMKKSHLNFINDLFECEPIEINSARVSAQSRVRNYWTNIASEATQPEDLNVHLKDILESGWINSDKSYWVGASKRGRYVSARQVGRKLNADGKRDDYNPNIKIVQRLELRGDEKSNCLTTVQKDSLLALKIDPTFCEQPSNKTEGCTKVGGVSDKPLRIGHFNKGSQGDRVYSTKGKSVCLSAQSGGKGGKTGLYYVELPDGEYIVRKLTPIECERLQTLPDDYTKLGIQNGTEVVVSNSQRYKMLGNGWTVKVIEHLLKPFVETFNKNRV